MAHDQIKLSYQPLILVGIGVLPTIPSATNALPGDVGWVDATDLLMGQSAYNITDNKYYIRSGNGIIPLKKTMYYIHDQGIPNAEWDITHNLGCRPNVTVTDTAGQVYIGSVEYTNDNNLKVSFSGGFSGKAYLN